MKKSSSGGIVHRRHSGESRNDEQNRTAFCSGQAPAPVRGLRACPDCNHPAKGQPRRAGQPRGGVVPTLPFLHQRIFSSGIHLGMPDPSRGEWLVGILQGGELSTTYPVGSILRITKSTTSEEGSVALASLTLLRATRREDASRAQRPCPLAVRRSGRRPRRR